VTTLSVNPIPNIKIHSVTGKLSMLADGHDLPTVLIEILRA
jgi:hypothetical protein